MPDWSMEKWHKGRKMTLLEAFGISNEKFHFPQLVPVLPQKSAQNQQPIQVSSGGTQPVNDRKPPPPKGPIQQYARKLLRQNGWSNQWDSFNSIVVHESGWNPKIANPSSGAYGIAQAYRHGTPATQGTFSDMYGGFGLTDKQAKAANSGDPYWQLVWMMNYIKATYGSPDAAWAQYYQHPGGQGSY